MAPLTDQPAVHGGNDNENEEESLHLLKIHQLHGSQSKSAQGRVWAIGVWPGLMPWILNAFLVVALIYMLAVGRARGCTGSPDQQNGAYSEFLLSEVTLDRGLILQGPAEEAVSYVPVTFGVGFGKTISPYQGFPNDETDRLWEDMYACTSSLITLIAYPICGLLFLVGVTIHISDAAHHHLLNNTERVPLVGLENEYMIGLDVFHQLHCLV